MTIPDCPHRGRISGNQCFCRHPQITGPRRKSTPVLLSRCETCPIPNGDVPIQLSLPSSVAKPRLLGDTVESALEKVGITKERVSQWLGRPCGCEERKQKLNSLHAWARMVISGRGAPVPWED